MTATDIEVILGPVSAIPPGEGRNYEVAGERVAVFYTRSGQVFAVQANCPHKNGPLADGLVGGTTVICPLHAWKFDLTTGEPVMGSCRLKTYPVRLDGEGRILLTMTVPEMASVPVA
ncbi:MAG: nitrite reductase (NAD(P)H) small subunit [Acidobacteriaceae bacterium]|nr:nitrite reductase (NAD(P)H) small subunit [Acidobacteriaceae bacterium]